MIQKNEEHEKWKAHQRLKTRAWLDEQRKLREKADHRHKWKGEKHHRTIGSFYVICGVKGCDAIKVFYGQQGNYLCK